MLGKGNEMKGLERYYLNSIVSSSRAWQGFKADLLTLISVLLYGTSRENHSSHVPAYTHIHTMAEVLSAAGPFIRSNACLLASHLKSLSVLGQLELHLHCSASK